jgi:hypothetical protein
MAALTLQNIGILTALVPSYVAAASGGDTVETNADQRAFIHVKNGGGSSIDVGITAIKTTKKVKGVGTVAVASLSIAVPAGENRMIGPFLDAYLSGGRTVNITYSAVTNVTVAALNLARVD